MSDSQNPLLSPAPEAWARLIEAVEPASLLLVIESRMNAALRGVLTAEDILQDALLHAWRDRTRCEWRGLKSFRSWLLTIIDHRIGHAAERQSSAKRSAAGSVLSLSTDASGGDTSMAAAVDLPAGSTTPSRLAIYREQAEAMRLALEELPDECRDIVQQRYFEERSLDEIAERSGLGVSAVRHRFRKGSEIYARRLRTALGSRPTTVLPDAESGPFGE